MQTFRSLRTTFLLWAFILSTAATQANYADFNGNGTPDLLFMNKTTRKLEVWFDNTFMGAGSLNSQPITQNGSPWTVSEGWKLVGVGKFNTANTNQLGILLQHQPPASRAMVVWFLKTTNPTEIDFAGNVQYASPNWEAAAVGDFNGDGKSDIAFRYDLDRLNAIWLMNGLNPGSVGSYTNGSYHWRLTGAGDFGSGSNPTSGVKDGKDDLLFTHYDPSSNTIGMSQAGIWFMDGTTLTHASTVMNSSGQVMGLNPPDFRAVATANFDNGDGGNKTDLLIRHAVIGRQGVWRMSGYVFQAGAWIKPQPDPAWKLFSQDWLQSTWRHNEPYPKGFYPFISAYASSTSPVRFTLNFRIPPNPFGTYGLTIRRRVGEGAWTTLASNHTSDSYTDQDSSLTIGVRYEYEVWRQGSQAGSPFWYPARVFASVNQPIGLMENRGKVLVIVESNVFSGISTGLKTFTNSLIGDGWTVVLKADAPRHDNRIVACGNSYKSDPAADTANLNGRNTVKAFIDQHSDAKGIVLVGHVTVPLA